MKLDCKKESLEVTGSQLLLGEGSKPNTDSLNLKACGIQTDERGYIQVNDYMVSSNIQK
jgi:pyruvate/2-oxoglutarate dehydrogenase complex dihydrolipoamide dehydrogenase (E3) component